MNIKDIRERRKGYTIVELLVASTITLLVAASLVTIYFNLKSEYNSHKDRTNVESKELLVKSILYDFVKDIGFACKFGYVNQNYYDSTSDLLDSFFHNNSMLNVGALPLPESTHLAQNMVKNCSGNCHQAGTDYIMIKKENGHTELTSTNSFSTFINVDSTDDIQTNDYLLLCNRQHMNLVKVVNSTTAALTLSQAPQGGEYYPGDYVGKYSLEILYVADTGSKDSDGNDIYSLYLYTKSGTSSSNTYELVRGVKDLQVEYANISNGDITWSSISSNTEVDVLGYSALRVSFSIEGKTFSKIISL